MGASKTGGRAAIASRSDVEMLRPVRVWLYLVAFLVFVMVLIGGATRLTDSGLSITEWQLVTGTVPPLSPEAWQEEFDKYKLIPEFQRVNSDMGLADFKVIYWWEWGHRFLGRLIGVVFLIPLLWFAATGRIGRRLAPRLVLLFLLGGLQGAIGWWMVTSGLVDRVDVSQYRLAIHLTFAIILFAAILWVARSLGPKGGPADISHDGAARRRATLLLILIFVQIVVGALVAGIDAGLTYTTWPMMNGRILPPAGDLLIQSPWYVNFGENPLTVQFTHRMIAYGLLLFAWFHFLAARASRASDRSVAGALLLALAMTAQAIIGIVTLVMQVPIWLGLLHQAGALVVVAAVIGHRQDLTGAEPGKTPGPLPVAV